MTTNQRRRGKIEMVKIEDHASRQATFSKRRYGIFKKASELCTLCDVEMGIIVFAPSGKVHSFGNPDINSVTSRFNHNYFRFIENSRNKTSDELSKQLDKALEKYKNEKTDKKVLDQMLIEADEVEKEFLDRRDLISVLKDLSEKLPNQKN